MRHWDWDGMVEANRGRLIGLLAGVFALLGTGETVRRVVWRAVLARLVPMESALRRLIFILACEITVTVGPARSGSGRRGSGAGMRKPVFALTEPLRDPDGPSKSCPRGREPRICSLDDWTPRDRVPEPSDDDLLDASALARRMAAMEAALTDLPAQAMRMARWQARNARDREGGTWRRLYAFRSGRAPGHRQRAKRPEDEVLATCHDLALCYRAMVEAERAKAG